MQRLTKKFSDGVKERTAVREIVYIGMFAAVLAVLSQISIPIPSGVPITLQTFAAAMTGYVLAWKRGTASTFIYILLGAVGVPVFSGFRGGIQVLVNHTGGFIWGFIFMALFCGIGVMKKNKAVGIMYGILGLAICHLLGVIQFAVVMKREVLSSFFLVSAPYLIKDIISVVFAYILGYEIRKALIKSDLI